MLGAFLFTFLPTLFFYLLITKANFLKSQILKISLSWFIGQYLGTWVIFILSNLLILFTTSVLTKASFLFLLALIIGLLFLKAELLKLRRSLKLTSVSLPKTAIVTFCFIFAYFLFSPHLAFIENKIYTSPVYWDFNIHFPIIQNFVFGDNFPPQNESFSGIPMTYHYFFDLLNAIYSSLGLNLVYSMNFVSILSFSFMLMAIIGFCEEIFKSTAAGILAVIFTVTSSSLHFLDYFSNLGNLSFPQIIVSILRNSDHPFFFSFVKGNLFGYNGTMFNIFYFIAERQMILSVLFIILFLTLIHHRRFFSERLFLMAGILLALFWQWHLFTTITVGTSIVFLLLFLPEKRKMFFLLSGFGVVSLFNFFYFHSLLKPEWFYKEILDYPKINFNFPTMLPNYPFSLTNIIGYYLYAYGLKIIFLPLSLFILFKKNKQLFFLAASIIIPTFILANSVQLSPLSVYDNHKWIRPMNAIVDIVISATLVDLFLKNSLILKTAVVISFFTLTLSGFLELIPFLNSKPTNLYASYPTNFIQTIRDNTPTKSSFLALGSKELHLAGRKLFLGSSADEPGATSVLDSNKFNRAQRENIIKSIYSTEMVSEFCQMSQTNNIDYVEVIETAPINSRIRTFPSFTARSEKGKLISFVDIKKGCELFDRSR